MKYTYGICCGVIALNSLPTLGLGALKSINSTTKPNILWLVSEDNSPYFGIYGDTVARTPNVDKWAKTGVTYNHAFANAPVSAAARNTIITGMYPNSLGNHQMRSRYKIPEFVELFPVYLKNSGYYTTNCFKEDYNTTIVGKEWNYPWNESSQKATYRHRKPGQPFFHIQNLGVTHESSLFDSIPDDKLDFKPGDMVVYPQHPNTPDFRHDYAQYYQRISSLDKQIGAFLEQLKKDGQADSTIVFYFSDHGGVLPRGKRYLFESGTRVPMVVYVPDMYKHLMPDKIGSHSNRVISFVDLAPSILNAVGIKIPDYMQGQPFIGKNVPKSKEYAFMFRGRMDEQQDLVLAVRDIQYRYIRNYYPERIYGQYIEYLWRSRAIRDWENLNQQGKLTDVQTAYWRTKPFQELYDIEKDPHNINNLALDPKFAKVLQRMSNATDKWIEQTEPLDVLPEPLIVDIDNKAILYDSIKGSAFPLMKVHEVARMSARADRADFKKLFEYSKDKNPVIAFWGIKAMFQYENELKVAGLLDEIKKNLSRSELYLQNITANLLASLGEKASFNDIIINGINSKDNMLNRLEALLLYQRLERDSQVDEAIAKRYNGRGMNGYEKSIYNKIMTKNQTNY